MNAPVPAKDGGFAGVETRSLSVTVSRSGPTMGPSESKRGKAPSANPQAPAHAGDKLNKVSSHFAAPSVNT